MKVKWYNKGEFSDEIEKESESELNKESTDDLCKKAFQGKPELLDWYNEYDKYWSDRRKLFEEINKKHI